MWNYRPPTEARDEGIGEKGPIPRLMLDEQDVVSGTLTSERWRAGQCDHENHERRGDAQDASSKKPTVVEAGWRCASIQENAGDEETGEHEEQIDAHPPAVPDDLPTSFEVSRTVEQHHREYGYPANAIECRNMTALPFRVGHPLPRRGNVLPSPHDLRPLKRAPRVQAASPREPLSPA